MQFSTLALFLAPLLAAADFSGTVTLYPEGDATQCTSANVDHYYVYDINNDSGCQNAGVSGHNCEYFTNSGSTGPAACNDAGFLSNYLVISNVNNMKCDTFSDANCKTVVGNSCLNRATNGNTAEHSLSGTSFHSFKCYAA